MIAGSFIRIATVAAVCALLGACGSTGAISLTSADLAYASGGYSNRGTTPAYPNVDPRLYPDDTAATAPATIDDGPRLQCVPYAREHSGVNIHGDAYTWWDKAAGVYYRGTEPLLNSVMVMVGYAGRNRAHVAVVTRMVSPREIRINHANWLNDGKIYVNNPVVDVSDANDWSQVKVWNIRTGSWGTKIYTIKGFIGPGLADSTPTYASSGDFGTVVASWQDPIARTIAAGGNLAPASHTAPSSAPLSDDEAENLLNDAGVDQ